METLELELPTMYGDHHVLEVRRLLFELPGVEDVYASSSFQTVVITYDAAKVSSDNLRDCLQEAGYIGSLTTPVETGAAAYLEKGDRSFFRHTTVYENIRQNVSFQQNVSYLGRPLWSCPGMGLLRSKMVEEE